MDFRNFALATFYTNLAAAFHFLLHPEFLFQFLLLFSQFLLDLLQKSRLIKTVILRLFARHDELSALAHKLVCTILIFLELVHHWYNLLFREVILVPGQCGVVSVVKSLIHQICDFRPELLPLLIPAPFVDLGLRET